MRGLANTLGFLILWLADAITKHGHKSLAQFLQEQGYHKIRLGVWIK